MFAPHATNVIPDNNALELDNWVVCSAVVDVPPEHSDHVIWFCGAETYTGSAYCPAHLNREIW